MTRVCYCYCEAEVHSSSVSVVYVVRLRIVFSKAALQKRGSIEPMEPPLDPPLGCLVKETKFSSRGQSTTVMQRQTRKPIPS